MQSLLRLTLFTSIALVLACYIFAAGTKELPIEGVLDGTWRADVSDSQLLILSIENSKIEMTKGSKGTLHFCGGALFIGRFRSTGFLNTWKSRPEFEKQVANQRKEVKDKLSRRST